MGLPTRWIICTKWAIVDFAATQEALNAWAALPSVIKETQKAPDATYRIFWTPVGSAHVFKSRSKVSGVPYSYATEQEATDGLHKIVNDDPKLAEQELKFSAVEVRYVPNKIKAYKQDWFDKYAIKETELLLKEHKFIDKMK
jgi:hypothetical protein